jgi:hypothetical protein
MGMTFNNGQEILSFPTIATSPQYGLQRYYTIESCTNLLSSQAWLGIAGWTNLQASGKAFVYTNISAGSKAFWRGRVWLGP